MERLVLDYRLPEDYSTLVQATRYDALRKDEKYLLFLSDGLIIEGLPERCLMNLLIFRVLDYYKIFKNRQEYLFIGSYVKGAPEKYMNLVLDLIEQDDDFKKDVDDYVILLPHVLAEVKEQFYLIGLIVNGMIMTDHSLFGYIEGYRNIPEFRKLMEEPIIEPSDAPWVVERKLKDMLNLFDDKINIHPLSDFYRSGVKVNRGQLMMYLTWG